MKDFLVHMDGGERSETRLDIAIRLTKAHGGRLTGLFAQSDSNSPAVIARRPSDQLLAASQRAEVLFESKVAAAGLTGSRWWALGHGEYGHVVSETVFCARYADLVILGQWSAETARVPEEMVEQVVMNSGRPVLTIPHSGDFPTVGESIAIAWNGSREATRALHDAMDLLCKAHQVHILAVRDTGPGGARPDNVPQVDVRAHLEAHGIIARTERLAGEDIGVMDLLLSRAYDLGSDLLVMGAHGGLGIGFLRGAGTRFMLRHMTMPVLMSN